MASHVNSFMKSILGEDGQQAFSKMVGRAPSVGALLAPRTILGWINTASSINYEGELPGVTNSYVSLSKSDSGIYGAVALDGVQHTFEGHDLVHVAAAISQALGVESIDLDPNLRDTDISKLGKSIDLLVKARTIAHVGGEEMVKFALAPTKMTQHGGFHIVHTPGQKYPYSIHNTATNEQVQGGIATLQNAQVIAKWHASRPMVKAESPGQAAAARPPLQQQPGPAPQATQPIVNKPPMQKSDVSSLPFLEEEKWDDGRKVIFRASPFPVRRTPALPSKLAAQAKVEKVPLDRIYGSQSRVTEHGVQQYLDQQVTEPPLVYREHDGSFTIGDGHHRLVAAHLRGEKEYPSRVVDVPKIQKSTSRRELMVKHEDAGKDCPACGQKLFSADTFVGCLCFRALAKSVQTRDTQAGFVLKLTGSDWDVDTVQTLISTFRR